MDEKSKLENVQTSKDKNILDLIKKIKDMDSNEKKIQQALEEMKISLNNEEKADFKTFWEIKNLCLELFKEPVNSSIRSLLWKEYLEISNEAKRIKNIMFQQMDFEIEQIDLAISSIENDISNYDDILSNLKDIEIDFNSKTLSSKKTFYLEIQKELNLLNTIVVRINSLRKEIIKIQMRISNKNKFLQRLSVAGDFIFPKRKELIESLSDEFSKAVEDFEKKFNLDKTPFHVLRDEVRSLQNAAKNLNINSQSYMNTRLNLSKCWDKIKAAESNYKKEREASRGTIEAALVKIAALRAMCEANPEDKNIEKEEKEIFNFIKTLNLKPEDVKFLKHKVNEAKDPIFEKKLNEKKEKIKKASDQENIKNEKIEKVKDSIINLLSNAQLTLEEIYLEKGNIEQDLNNLNPAVLDKISLKKYLRQLDHLVEDKKEIDNNNNLMDLESLHKIFDVKKQRKVNIRNYLEGLNKELSGSNFDFEKAMAFRDLIDFEKQKLSDIENSIEELEEKISHLESN
ncbi:MAG: hypothetical protein WCT85_07070 [Parachlamydiales bacterium]|jgi:hypothetical protein